MAGVLFSPSFLIHRDPLESTLHTSCVSSHGSQLWRELHFLSCGALGVVFSKDVKAGKVRTPSTQHPLGLVSTLSDGHYLLFTS